MQFATEEGLTFNCKPLSSCKFDFKDKNNIYVITIKLDDDYYAVCAAYNERSCKLKVCDFVGKYKITAIAQNVTINKDGKYEFTHLYEYKYEYYLKREPSTRRHF